RSTSTPSATPPGRCWCAGGWSTSRRPGSTPATRPAGSRRSPSGRTSAPPRHARAPAPGDAPPRLGRALGVIGILNVQFAFKGERLYVLEANPRASRSVPFVEKVTGRPRPRAGALLLTGSPRAGRRLEAAEPAHVGVKEAVLPFARFPGADSLLGP